MTQFNVPTAFQWIKGESLGKFVRSTGKTYSDGMDEYLIFEDGTQCNANLIGEWIIPMDAPAPVTPGFVAQPTVVNPPNPAMEAAPIQNPVHSLLEKSKKQSTCIEIKLYIDMPSPELLRVVNDSYEDGESHIQNYLVSTVNQDTIMEQIAAILGDRVNTIVNPVKSTKYEKTI